MIRLRNGGRRTPVILLVICLGLAYVLYLEVRTDQDGGHEGITVALPPAQVTPLPSPSAFRVPPIRTFRQTVARPLFSQSRRPPIGPAPKTGSGPKPVGFKLTGIVISPYGRTALIRPPRSADIIEIVEGQNIEGWRVDSIRPDRVVLRFGNTKKEIRIEDEVQPAPGRTGSRSRKRRPARR